MIMDKKDSEKAKDIPLYGIVDERTKSVVNQGDAYTVRFMLFAVLIDVVIRGLGLYAQFFNSNWDLMLIVIIGGFISTAYQIKSKVMLKRPISRSLVFLIALMSVSALIAFIFKFFIKR